MVNIYKIISPSGKIYIGQTSNVSKRINHYRRLDCKHQTKLYNSIKKYGWYSHIFKVLHELPKDAEQNIINAYEQLYIDLYKDCNSILLNLREAGSIGKMSDVTRQKMRESRIGKKHAPEVISKMKISQKGNKNSLGAKHKPRSIETRKKLSLANKGKRPWLGKRHSEKTKEGMRLRRHSEETINKLRAVRRELSGSRPVIAIYPDGHTETFLSLRDIERGIGVAHGNVSRVLKGEYKQANGYKFKYA